jgi:hypothetical protein
MTTWLLGVAVAVALVALSLLRGVVTSLVVGEVKGVLMDKLQDRARHAATMLSNDVAEDVLDEWLAELEALTDRPVSAMRFARGLRKAASAIAAEGASLATPSEPVEGRTSADAGVDLISSEHLFQVKALKERLLVDQDFEGASYARWIERAIENGESIRTINIDQAAGTGKFLLTTREWLSQHGLELDEPDDVGPASTS